MRSSRITGSNPLRAGWQLLATVGGLGLLLALLIGVIDWASFERSFYARVYERLDTAGSMGISETQLTLGTDVLLGYLRGRYPNLDLEIEVADDGSTDQFFNEREKAHMVDVKALYDGARTAGAVGLAISLAVLVILFSRWRSTGLRYVWRGWLWAVLAAAALLTVLLIWVLIDFNGFWTRFHLIFFSNDLWILDPRTDRLINMVPSYFFNTLVRRIISVWLGAAAALTVILGIAAHRVKQGPVADRDERV